MMVKTDTVYNVNFLYALEYIKYIFANLNKNCEALY